MSGVFPTNYTDKTTLVDWDKVFWYDSESATPAIDWNKNFAMSAVANHTMSTKDTDDLSEWSNLYFTDARVTSNETVVDLWTDKADKTNVLELDNTTTYTPTADYHPATKKYVDDFPVPSASETTEWIVERLTQTEAFIWEDTTRYMNSVDINLIHANVWFVASDTLISSADTQQSVPWTAVYTKEKEIKAWYYPKWWTIKVKFDIFGATWAATYGRVYKNWVAFWTEQVGSVWTWTTFSEDLAFTEWDLIQLYGKCNVSWWLLRNFRLYYDEVTYPKTPTINLN